jgi:hypothetical protein
MVSLPILTTGILGIIALPSAGGEVAIIHHRRRRKRAQEIERRNGQVGIDSGSSVEQGIQNDQHGGPVDVAWIVAQTVDYLTHRDTHGKLLGSPLP